MLGRSLGDIGKGFVIRALSAYQVKRKGLSNLVKRKGFKTLSIFKISIGAFF
jgi:hypothetical protein